MPARVNGLYSRAERISDAAVHLAGIAAALVLVPTLIICAALWLGDRRFVIAAGIYGVSFIAMLGASALYHMAPAPAWKDQLRRLDQSAIYLKIAGTYTPFAVLSGPQGMPFLAGLWATAAAGVSIKLMAQRQLFGLTLALYLLMGWAAVVAGAPILDRMTPLGFNLVLLGGCLYTVGVVFLLWERLPFHNTIWHVFVLTASLVLYAAIFVEMSGLATG